mmetsp:Transcript_5685/g.6725  ORF Transcript_5685/g.6725 Transcript_5685/m.6725 type:complete len:609 (+) Transcript_5685:120-1946(+)|eukprot:CAMPEP_0204837198 /NCGR_PEP_ID=MMETSP1346-20131115/27286_1 /ASSEMBLY_ACC=CAM_ASM_000771 /TAXON_ID=215587 /ORGANISM="Aplanochytrium stocchinoi, Strain GSBS06" /LENGTH=608 /DNA_ID=CAMNT_0051972493 /DNA_START=69 /DNA_END=1895 /DNA_ORIENTATION=-
MVTDDSAKAERIRDERRQRRKYLCWSIIKISGCFLLLLITVINVWTTVRIKDQFATELQELDEINAAIYKGNRRLNSLRESNVPTPVLSAGSRKKNEVLKVLSIVESVEKAERAPKHRENQVVILGKGFIMKRDFEIWDYTFQNHKFMVEKSTKQDVAQRNHDNWAVMVCLDLFDGKTHCIEPGELPTLKRYQKVSRLYGLRKTLWNKDRFCETMSTALNGFENFTEFVFPCWILPHDYEDLIKQATTKYTKRSFILKPTDRGEGNGINVMDNYHDLANWKAEYPDNDEVVVQTYLPNPLLINKRKWDMRTYVLVTSIHPLRAYMYRDGLVRFASSKYDANAKDGGKKTAFLTNTSVNKKSGIDVEDLTWPFPKLYETMSQLGMDPEVLWESIERAIVQVLLSSENSFARQFKKLQNDYTCVNCYQLLGVDIIVDDTLTPRVIEVNGEPSMQLSGEKDSQYDFTKKSMTNDVVSLLFSHDSFSRPLTADLTELELSGFAVGYEDFGCSPRDDVCLSRANIKYLLDMKKEQQNMGGFRRIYPSKTGDYFTAFLAHLETKMPYGTLTSTYRIHKLVTALEKMSKWKSNNDVEASYNVVPSKNSDMDEEED